MDSVLLPSSMLMAGLLPEEGDCPAKTVRWWWQTLALVQSTIPVVMDSPPSHSNSWVVGSYCPLLQMTKLRPRWEDKALRFKAGKEPKQRVRRPGSNHGAASHFLGLCLPICKVGRLDLLWGVSQTQMATGQAGCEKV